MKTLTDLHYAYKVAAHVPIDPDDITGFTTHCFEAFCKHYGYDYPLDEAYKYHAQTLWNETPGDAWRAAWTAAMDFPAPAKLMLAVVEECMAWRSNYPDEGMNGSFETDKILKEIK